MSHLVGWTARMHGFKGPSYALWKRMPSVVTPPLSRRLLAASLSVHTAPLLLCKHTAGRSAFTAGLPPYPTPQDLLTRHKAVVAQYLQEHYQEVRAVAWGELGGPRRA